MQSKLNKTSPHQLLAQSPRRTKPSKDSTQPKYCVDLPCVKTTFLYAYTPSIMTHKTLFLNSGIMLHFPEFSVQFWTPSVSTQTSDFFNSASKFHPEFLPIQSPPLLNPCLQSSDLQILNSYPGIIDICCHSVGPSCMIVLRILL